MIQKLVLLSVILLAAAAGYIVGKSRARISTPPTIETQPSPPAPPPPEAKVSPPVAPPSTAPVWTGTVDFGHDRLHPMRDDVYIRSLEQTGDGFAMLLTLDSDQPDFASFKYSLNGAPEVTATERPLKLLLNGRRITSPVEYALKIHAVDGAGRQSAGHDFHLGFYSDVYYAANGGGSGVDYIVLQSTSMRIKAPQPAAIAPKAASETEQASAKKLWGRLIENEPSTAKKAQLILEAISRVVDGSSGVPSGRMNAATPFQQYEWMAAGEEKGWCGNKTVILEKAFAALGIRCRQVGFGRFGSRMNNVEYRAGVGHSVLEVYDGTLNKWCWMDESLNILEGRLNGEGPLNLLEFVTAFNNPILVKSLEIVRFDSKTGVRIVEKLTASPLFGSMRAYYGRHQAFEFRE